MIAAADMNYNLIINLIHFNLILTEKQEKISHSLMLSNVSSIISLRLLYFNQGSSPHVFDNFVVIHAAAYLFFYLIRAPLQILDYGSVLCFIVNPICMLRRFEDGQE